MSGETQNLFTQSQIFPKYVSDDTLKRARVDTSDGPSIRVAGTFSGSSTDITPITDALGTTSDTSSTPTLIGLTKLGNSSLNDIDYTALSIDTKVGNLATPIGDIKTGVTSLNTAIGTTADTSSVPTLIGLTKLGNSSLNGIDYTTTSIDTKVGNLATPIGDIKTGITSITSDVGTIETDVDSISTKTGNIETMLGNNLGNIALSTTMIETYTDNISTSTQSSSLALGNKADAAWSGSGSGSIIAILKSIYSKL